MLNRYYKNQLIESVTEEELLDELEHEKSFGNRVFIIFGSTGSGKSELLCWIRDQWNIRNNNRPIIRISRNELNPQILIKKCYEYLGMDLGELIIDEDKWNLLLNKPITIINQMVWTTMSELFESDDSIVPAAMLLRPVIEKNILDFTKQIKKGQINKPLEIITLEEFEELIESTSIEIDLQYYKFRDTLLKKLDQFLFQGTDIRTIFQKMSKVLIEENIRPVLLIDDLVQSINLYAADFLDYFITLEEGNWDVVVGVTPGVEQGTNFDHDLKNRIKNLDTIDDRVKKFWLSDEAGSSFFTLEKKQAHDYLEKYIVAMKESNGFICSEQCPHAKECGDLIVNSNSPSELKTLPLSSPLINRIYDGIPIGKGTLRYLILNSREILQFLIKGEAKKARKIQHYLYRDVFINHEDHLIKLLGEMYSLPSEETHIVSSHMLKHFNYDSVSDIVLHPRGLQSYKEINIEEQIIAKKNPVVDHIRDWIEGNKVKEQLLEPVRAGVATIVHEIVKGTNITKEHTARTVKTTATLQRSEVINRYRYPISFTPNKNSQILIEEDINLLKIAGFQQLKTQDKSDVFEQVVNDRNISKWIYQAEQLKENWREELEQILGYRLQDFAYYFKLLINNVNLIGESEWTTSIKNPIKREWLEIVEDLFLDWYSLRDNIIDYKEISIVNKDEQCINGILTIVPSKKLNSYQIRNYSLQSFLTQFQKEVNQYLESIKPIAIEKAIELMDLYRVIDENPAKTIYHEKINVLSSIIQNKSPNIKDMINISEQISWLTLEENKEFIRKIQKQKAYLENMKKFLPLLDEVKEKEEFLIFEPAIMEEYLKNKLGVRSQVRKHLIKLLEKGETQLPRKQWKSILRDLEELSPEFFDKVNVLINVKHG
jgi:hypothetical protein